MVKFYELAGVGIAVRMTDAIMYDDDNCLAPFRVETVADPHWFDFEIVETLPVPQGECIVSLPSMKVYRNGEWIVRYIGALQSGGDGAYACIAHCRREHHVTMKASSCPMGIHAKSVLNCIAAERLIGEVGGLILHSSYIDVGGRAVLFTAPSQTGKSTQADLWHRLRGAAIYNGDRCAVRFTDGQVWACGIPFAGSSRISENVTLPLAAIVYLKQAKQTAIRRLRGAESFRRVWEGCSVNTWDRAHVDQISDTVTHILSSVPVFELACTPDESAIIALEGVLKP